MKKFTTKIKPDSTIFALASEKNEEQREAHAFAMIEALSKSGQISQKQAEKLKNL